MSVSNHKPYTYPKGRISENPDQHSRSYAVKYTDWALGDFFRLAKKEEFYKDTIFIVVADHGARVYGSQKIPIKSYRIPLLIISPTIKKPALVDTLGGSLDVTPTVLGMIGLPYTSVFFGRDLLKTTPSDRWAVMHHNRDIGLYRDGHMVVLGMNKTFEFYEMQKDIDDLVPLKQAGPQDEELKKDAAALFQVADRLYTQQKYHTE